MKPMNLELYIEELVLHGFAPGDRYRIGEAVERELARLFIEEGIPSFSESVDIKRLNGGTFDVAAGAKAEEIGVRVAHAVYGGMGQVEQPNLEQNSCRGRVLPPLRGNR